jgi:hypothetical protein
VGITGTLAQFNTALTGADFATGGGTVTGASSGTNTGDQTITLTGDVTGSGTSSFAATIANDAVSYAKIQNVSAASKLLGRGDSGAGDVQEITLGSGLTMTGTTLSASGGGDMVLASAQTNIGVKTFLDGTMALRNVDNTFSSVFTNTNTAARTYTLPDASGTVALLSNITGTNSGTNTGDVTLAGTPNYLTLAGQVITRSLIDLTTHVTGKLPFANIVDVATATVMYRKTAGTGSMEAQTLATLKTDLGLTGTNSGDQTITLTGDVTGSGTGSFAATIANNAVTLGKMATIATDSILGRATAGTSTVEVLTALPFAYTGDVTRAADSNATVIANAAVTYAKMQNVSAASRVLGRGSASGAGSPEELTIGSGLTLSGTVLSASAATATNINPVSYTHLTLPTM